jgi:hypothetical protein
MSKNISAAVVFAAIVSGFAINTFACGPFFPNNLLGDGDHAVLQPPIADFERELACMKIMPSRLPVVPTPTGQSFYDQSTEVEMSDLAVALKRAKMSSEQATVVMQAHLAQRMKLGGLSRATKRMGVLQPRLLLRYEQQLHLPAQYKSPAGDS